MKPYILLALTAVVITACDDNNNTVRSEKALILAADDAALPPIPDGVWGFNWSSDCEYDVNTPRSQWPDCIQASVVRAGKVVFPEGHLDAALSGVLRLPVSPGLMVGQQAPKEPEESAYKYYGIAILSADRAGRPRKLRSLTLKCGPPPEGSTTSEGTRRTQTLAPFKGAVMDEDGCAPRDRAGLVAIALANRRLPDNAPDPAVSWIRSEMPGDMNPRESETVAAKEKKPEQ
jgi:hypothetical protein